MAKNRLKSRHVLNAQKIKFTCYVDELIAKVGIGLKQSITANAEFIRYEISVDLSYKIKIVIAT